MEQLILDLLNSPKAYTVKEIANELGIKNENDVRMVLTTLCDEFKVHQTKKNKYVLFENSIYKKGLISVAKGGYGFVDFGGKRDAFIHIKDLNGAKDGDLVAIEVTLQNKDKCEGKVVKVGPRKEKALVGEVVTKKKRTYIVLDDKKEDMTVILDAKKHNLIDGMKVIVTLKDEVSKNTFTADVKEVLGHKDDPGVDLLSIIKQYGIVTEFPEEVVKEAEALPKEVTEEEIKDILSKGGKDLRNEMIFTIDGDDTKDIDDALSLTILPNGHYNLKVHIANVSHYVPPTSATFKFATLVKGTSTYVPSSSSPMLHRLLSNGICSLNPEVDRLAVTFDMELDEDGNLIKFTPYESIIRSRKQMTYKNVNKILEDGVIPEGYEEFASNLKTMHKLALKIRKNKVLRGFIDFDLPEQKIKLDEKGKPIDISLYPRGEAERLIEDFMVLTGEGASNFLDNLGYKDKHVYRVHGEPKDTKIFELKAFLTALGYRDKTKYLKEMSPKNLQTLLKELSNKKEYLVIARELLKCMQKASYSTRNIGHFALASGSTCQVTSPIRRAGDLENHVLIKDAIYQRKPSINTDTELMRMCQVASQTERNSEECERACNKMKAAEYMKKHIGEEFEGTITGLVRAGFFVELPNLVEGFVNVINIPNDNYVWDKEKYAFIGRSTKQRYRLGDRVTIRVVGASKEAGTIDFEVLQKENIKVKVKEK